jgi:hypothetical protein
MRLTEVLGRLFGKRAEQPRHWVLVPTQATLDGAKWLDENHPGWRERIKRGEPMIERQIVVPESPTTPTKEST